MRTAKFRFHSALQPCELTKIYDRIEAAVMRASPLVVHNLWHFSASAQSEYLITETSTHSYVHMHSCGALSRAVNAWAFNVSIHCVCRRGSDEFTLSRMYDSRSHTIQTHELYYIVIENTTMVTMRYCVFAQ